MKPWRGQTEVGPLSEVEKHGNSPGEDTHLHQLEQAPNVWVPAHMPWMSPGPQREGLPQQAEVAPLNWGGGGGGGGGGRSQENGPFQTRTTTTYCNSFFHASFTANDESDSLIIVHSYPSLALPPFPGSLWHSNRPPFSLVTTLTVKDRAFTPLLEGIASIPWSHLPGKHSYRITQTRGLVRYISEGLRRGFYNYWLWQGQDQEVSCLQHDLGLQEPRPSAEIRRQWAGRGSDHRPTHPPEEAADIHVSHFGVISKRHQPGQLILDLSSPDRMSINDGIDKELSSLQYESVDDAARILMGNADCNVPVHPTESYLLGMQWKGETYIDTALPFGLRSAPKFFWWH